MIKLQNLILEMVARGEELKTTTDRLCLEIERRVAGVTTSILRVDPEGRLRPLSGPSIPKEFAAGVDGLKIGPMAGSCGSAAYLRTPIAITDIESDPRWTRGRSLALSCGFKACWSSPICEGSGRVLGTFAFYFREKRGPTNLERDIVDTCVHLCVIALERHQRVLERQRLAHSDGLTNLPNRMSFDTALANLRQDAAASLSLLLLDLDNLKIVNDTFGHRAGDALLQVVGKRLVEAAAPHPAYRLGGDEFAVLMNPAPADDALNRTAEKILEVMAKPAECDGRVVVPGATIGLASTLAAGSPEIVRRNADVALYHAKETNRGGFVLYSPRLATTITRRYDAIHEVARALSSGRIDAHYQPIVDLESRKIIALEALCRIVQPNGDVTPAAEFHEATSDARVASQLTNRMLNVVAADVRTWLDLGIPFQHVGINISSADFHGRRLCAQLSAAFGSRGVPLKHIIIEVTESVYMRQNDQVVPRTINKLRSKGVCVALDDFGTGFASLTHLLTTPVDKLKIDKSFIDRLAPGDASSVIVEGLVGIARKLGIKVIAEGVETEQQLSQLRAFGCAYGQGYLFSRPVPRDQTTEMLLRLAQEPNRSLQSAA